MICPKCKNTVSVKNGHVRKLQRYLCRRCSYNFTDTPRRGKTNSVKRMALHMYLEGLGFEAIGRVLGVSDVAVLKWVRSAGEKLKELLDENETVEVADLELDELWHWFSKKNKSVGSGWLLIELQGESLPGPKVRVVQTRQKSSGRSLST